MGMIRSDSRLCNWSSLLASWLLRHRTHSYVSLASQPRFHLLEQNVRDSSPAATASRERGGSLRRTGSSSGRRESARW